MTVNATFNALLVTVPAFEATGWAVELPVTFGGVLCRKWQHVLPAGKGFQRDIKKCILSTLIMKP